MLVYCEFHAEALISIIWLYPPSRLESLAYKGEIAEWAHRFAWGERYLYIKIVVIGVAHFCGQVVKVLVRRVELSSSSVDKGVETVDKKWMRVPITTPTLPDLTKIALQHLYIPTEIPSYPQLSTPFPHLGVKVVFRTTLKRSYRWGG